MATKKTTAKRRTSRKPKAKKLPDYTTLNRSELRAKAIKEAKGG